MRNERTPVPADKLPPAPRRWSWWLINIGAILLVTMIATALRRL